MILFENQTGNGNSPSYTVDPPNHNHISFTLMVAGTMDGATVKVQASADEINWVDIPLATVSTATTYNFEINTVAVRAVLSSAGASTDVHVAIQSSEKNFVFT